MTRHNQAAVPQQPAGAPAGSRGPPPSPSHTTDLANARRLVAGHGRELRYCYEWGKWLLWTGISWAVDDTGEVFRRAKAAVAGIYWEAANAATQGERQGLEAWARASESAAKIQAMITLAESEPGVQVTAGQLDADPWLLNVRNGTVNLRTGRLRAHDRDDLITIVAPVEHEPEAGCPRWRAFLTKVFRGNEALMGFMQRSLGYALTGDVGEQCLWMLYGAGANGKSTLQSVILGILGRYGKAAPPGLLLQSRYDRHPTEIADLRGARFVPSVEIGEGKALAEEQVKRLTGGDRLKGRFMRQDFWEFIPTHKLFVACNHRPTVRGTDHAIWRRIKLVPFTVQIPDREQDKELPAKLLAEASGILNWLIAGCLAWQKHGLQEPEEITSATAEYRFEQDVLGDFLADRCIEEAGHMVKKGALFEAYLFWAAANGEQALTRAQLSKRLQERGFFGERKGPKNEHYWVGLSTVGGKDDPGM